MTERFSLFIYIMLSLFYYFLSLLLSLFIPFTIIYVFQNVQNKTYYKIRDIILGNLHHSPLQKGCVRNEGMNICVCVSLKEKTSKEP